MTNFNTAMETYDDRLIAIATADADWKLARAQWLANNQAISRLQVLVAIAFTDKDDANTKMLADKGLYNTAESDYTTASENMTRTATQAATSTLLNIGFTTAETAAQSAWETAETNVYGAATTAKPSGGTNTALGVYAATTGTGATGSGQLGSLFDKRATAATKYSELVTA